MSAERRQRLDAIGFVWDEIEVWWEEGFAALKAFKEREGHCRLPHDHIEGIFKLGRWVGYQRKRKDIMSAERKQRLDEIGFIWDILEVKWEGGFAALEKFKAREGHCNVPQGYRDERDLG
jgi:Helicase associated domain